MSRRSGDGTTKGGATIDAVGVVGLGKVGGTVAEAFRKVGVDVIGVDPYLGVGSAADVGRASVVFVCVPTPAADDRSLDVSAVWKAIADIEPDVAASTIIAVKSTVPPGTSDELAAEYRHLDFASVPEFLVARAPMETFARPDRVVIGARSRSTAQTLGALMRLVAPTALVVAVSPTEAELIKLCSNAMLAAKVSMANELALICEAFGVAWTVVEAGMGADTRIGPSHLSVNPERGFSGGCLPKDLDGLIEASRRAGHPATLLYQLARFNRAVRIPNVSATFGAEE